MKRTCCVLTAILAVALSAGDSAANVLSNPGFEMPTTTTTSQGNWFRFDTAPNGTASDSTVMPRSGLQHVELKTLSQNQFGGVFQQLPGSISPGETVTFSGWHRSVLSPYAATSEIKIEWTGAPQNRIDVMTLGTTYEMFTHSAVAPPGTTGATVTYAISSFGAGLGNATVHIDDFSAVVVPEPSAAAVLGLGLLGSMRLRRRRAS